MNKKLNNINWIFFDAGGVLLTIRYVLSFCFDGFIIFGLLVYLASLFY